MGNKSTIPTAPQEVEWIRAKQVTARFGIGHCQLDKLRKGGKIRTSSLKEPGQKLATRLYNVESIRAHIARCEQAEQAEQAQLTTVGGDSK